MSPSSGGTVVAVAGELDLATGPGLEQALGEQLGASGRVILDLARVTFMDSSGVRILRDAVRAPQAASGGLTIRPALHDHVRQVLELTGMLALLPFEPRGDRAS